MNTTTATAELDQMIAEAQAEALLFHQSSGFGNYWRIRLAALEDARATLNSEESTR